jgi:hypothetical protein
MKILKYLDDRLAHFIDNPDSSKLYIFFKKAFVFKHSLETRIIDRKIINYILTEVFFMTVMILSNLEDFYPILSKWIISIFSNLIKLELSKVFDNFWNLSNDLLNVLTTIPLFVLFVFVFILIIIRFLKNIKRFIFNRNQI